MGSFGHDSCSGGAHGEGGGVDPSRIAAGLSQKELAAKLGLKPQQIQRYEADNYQGASLGRVNAILRALGVKLRPGAELRLVS